MRPVRVVLVLCVLLLWACSTTSVSTRLLLPPRASVFQKPQTIVITPFSGPRGKLITDKVRAAIVNGGHHTLIAQGKQNATRIKQLERALAAGESVDMGKSVAGAATVIVTGNVHKDDYYIERETELVRKCRKTNKDGKCILEKTVAVHSISETCTSEINGRVIRVADGKVVFERNSSGTKTYYDSRENRQPRSQRKQICKRASLQAIEQFIPFITPHYATVNLRFRNIEDRANDTERAIHFAEVKQFGKARSLFEKVITDESLSPEDRAWARYNLSVVLWVQKQYQDCLTQLDQVIGELGNDGDVQSMYSECSDYLH